MVVITVNICAALQLGYWLAEYDDAIIELISFHSEFSCNMDV